jgi:hypothetical protein
MKAAEAHESALTWAKLNGYDYREARAAIEAEEEAEAEARAQERRDEEEAAKQKRRRAKERAGALLFFCLLCLRHYSFAHISFVILLFSFPHNFAARNAAKLAAERDQPPQHGDGHSSSGSGSSGSSSSDDGGSEDHSDGTLEFGHDNPLWRGEAEGGSDGDSHAGDGDGDGDGDIDGDAAVQDEVDAAVASLEAFAIMNLDERVRSSFLLFASFLFSLFFCCLTIGLRRLQGRDHRVSAPRAVAGWAKAAGWNVRAA